MPLLQLQTKGTKKCANFSLCLQYHVEGREEPFSGARENDDDLCSLNCWSDHSQLSTSSAISQNLMPTSAYQRRTHHNNSASVCTVQFPVGAKLINGCQSGISFEAPSVAAKEHLVSDSECADEAVRSLGMNQVECHLQGTTSSKDCPAGAGAIIPDADRVLNISCVDDNCSSSKSILDLSPSLKIDIDEAVECSSSGALINEKAIDEISEKDICISILRSQGLLDKDLTRQDEASATNTSMISNKSCKVCGHLESTSDLLICDNCEDAFHTSCCIPSVKRIPVGEWLCMSCVKKKHKILKEKSIGNSVNVCETARSGDAASDNELGSLELMFRDTEPYMSNVRIGDEFQAIIPDWSGPTDDASELVGDPLEIYHSITQEWDSTKLLKLSSIGNWLQCQEVTDGTKGVNGTVCGKWRRAPLFEVQTDDWECFRCILWDPRHADCAVPQEIETEKVMKQLKYIEMLRPRLVAKRRKPDFSKGIGAQYHAGAYDPKRGRAI